MSEANSVRPANAPALDSPTLAERVRADFPILATKMQGKSLVYFDNGATTQKPQVVIDAIVDYYSRDNANIHRGLYELSQRATDGFELARRKVANFIGAADAAECIFVRGVTEAVNLVAHSWGSENLSPGDEVLISGLEHHSNIVPWQLICDKTGAKLKVIYSDDDGQLDIAKFGTMVSANTKLVALQHVSNALGTIHDVAMLTRVAKTAGAVVLIDGAQWVGHASTNVQQIGCDFYTFSGHKLFAPTGIGVLWGRRELLEKMPPYQGGGDMIETVAFSGSTYAPLPNRFEAGTPDIAGAIGLGAAIDYLVNIGMNQIAEYENALLAYATERLDAIAGVRIVGRSEHKAAVLSFTIEQPSIAPMDIATALSDEGMAVRTGHHCCMPLMSQLQVPGTTRASLAFYNTPAEVDRFAEVLERLIAQRRTRLEQTNHKSKQNQATETSASTSKSGSESGENALGAGSSQTELPLTFAAASASSIETAAEELAEEFLEFDDRESKTQLLMELGQELPDDFEALKAFSTPVPGCMSEVYLVGRPVPERLECFEFAADSNADIVRGLIAVLRHLFSGQSAEAVIAFDIEAFFRRIGLDQFVSTQRRSGLDGMIRRVHTLASSIVER